MNKNMNSNNMYKKHIWGKTANPRSTQLCNIFTGGV